MNTLERKQPIEKKQKKKAIKANVTRPSDSQILSALYEHYGKPNHIVKEKVKLYKDYTNPAGHMSPDWILDGWQQGRVTVFTGHKVKPDDLFYTTKIEKEGVGTWFIAIKDNELKVSIGGKVDIILEIGV
jgi:hypothetical protein|tara:strand:+ start:547 stop:936 length:390 start_codon:yes stop_codon:yes gene_type:complete